jgi:hypothetical protein
MIAQNLAFGASLNLPINSFQPQNKEYQENVSGIALIFLILSGVILGLVIMFMILRLGLKKCVGPIKASQVTKAYRNITWILLVGALASLIAVYSVLLTYSFKINNRANEVLDYVRKSSHQINDTAALKIKELEKAIKDNTDHSIVTDTSIITNGLEKYMNVTLDHTNSISKFESGRNIASILIFVFYIIMAGLSFLSFFKRWPRTLLALSIILLVSLAGLLIFEGVTAVYYFVYSDACTAVHGAIYENQFPVYGQGLGWIISCFDSQTRGAINSFHNEVQSISDALTKQLKLGAKDSATLTSVQAQITATETDYIQPLIKCNHVYDGVQYFESNFCKTSMKNAYRLVESYTWLFLIVLLCAVAVNRLKPLVEKKKSELEVSLIF